MRLSVHLSAWLVRGFGFSPKADREGAGNLHPAASQPRVCPSPRPAELRENQTTIVAADQADVLAQAQQTARVAAYHLLGSLGVGEGILAVLVRADRGPDSVSDGGRRHRVIGVGKVLPQHGEGGCKESNLSTCSVRRD